MASLKKFNMAGVMGWPVMHSRSPLMHNYWLKQQALNGTYVPLEIKPERLGAALRALHPLGFAGCNLTIPHKQEALKIVDEVEAVAKTIGAISCVVVEEDGRLVGTNNDWLGFIGNLKQTWSEWRADAGPIAVIGAGGATRAVCYGLIQEGAREIRLVNRTLAHTQMIADMFGDKIRVFPWQERHSIVDGVALAVNTTSQGMVGQQALDFKLDLLPKNAIAADVIYTPLETPFLAAARARGNRTVNGLGMLLCQGPPAWQRWFGITPQVTDELRRLMEESIGQ